MAKHHQDGASGNSKTPRQRIRGNALALQCCKAHAKSNRKMRNSTSCKIATPDSVILKLCTRDDVSEAIRHSNFGFIRYSGGFSRNRRSTVLSSLPTLGEIMKVGAPQVGAGRAPSEVQGQSLWWRVRGTKPPEAESIVACGRPMDR